MGKMSGARYVAQTLKGYGITHVFFVEAILRRTLVEMEKLGISRILTHSEKAAAYMADGYARAGLKPGVCMAQSVGAANLAAGLQDAFLGHSPVIAFTGRKAPRFQYRNAYQEILHNPLYDTVTKYNVRVDTPEQLPLVLPQAFKEATTGTPGPVHLDFLGYEGELTDEVECDLELTVEPIYSRYPAKRPVPEEREIREAAKALSYARKPVLVVGRGAIVSGAEDEVARLAQRLSLPMVTSVDGKAVVTEDHPLYVGPVGSYGRACANEVVAKADLVFFVGTGTGDQVTKSWTLPKPGTSVIQLDINPSELGRSYPGTIGLLGDAKTALRLLLEALSEQKENPVWTDEVGKTVAQWRQKAVSRGDSDAVPIRPERLCKELTGLLPEDAVLVADTGYSAIWASHMILLNHPGQTFLRAAGSLGWAFPAALGVKCALPDRPVFCFAGDGAFWYHLCELETAARRNIKTVTVVNNNSRLGQCVVGISRAYRDDAGQKDHMYGFRETNFARMAEELGCFGVRVTSPEEIRGALTAAMAQDRPAVVDVVTDGQAHPF
jgi:acetolactate synthase-1/2/3 large subunit